MKLIQPKVIIVHIQDDTKVHDILTINEPWLNYLIQDQAIQKGAKVHEMQFAVWTAAQDLGPKAWKKQVILGQICSDFS